MKVAIIVAHPDDETLGCGATIANHIEKGDGAARRNRVGRESVLWG